MFVDPLVKYGEVIARVLSAFTGIVISANVTKNLFWSIYISPVGCQGIVRRKEERNLSINPRLEGILLRISATMSADDIERRSRVQKRGRFSSTTEEVINKSLPAT